ncbi:MAG: type II toxin-antitoxin system VapC family toxin [Pseudomonadota bacterium]
MRVLLDTHIFLWCMQDSPQLSKTAREMILAAEQVYISSASIWEAAIKIKLKKLDVKIDALTKAIPESGFTELSITIAHAAEVYKLPELHRDPFDRMLIAQAICEPLQFLTADKALLEYSSLVKVV